MQRPPLRTAAATFQIGCGLIAVLLCAVSATFLDDSASVDSARGLLAGISVLLGLALFAVWMAARSRRRWLLALIMITAALAVVMIMITVRLYAPARVNEQLGVWSGIGLAAVDAVLWLLIMVAAIIELRLLPKPADAEPRGWTYLPAIVAPLALVTALVIMLVSWGPGWLIRLNSQVSDVAPAAKVEDSALSGDSRWALDLDSSRPALSIAAGVAIPVPRDQTHSAGVIMIDSSTGASRWRYQLQGVDDAPELAATGDGHDLVVSFKPSGLEEGIIERTFTLSGETGRLQAVWPESGEVMGTDPPVLFNHVARGTNSVIAISPTGRKLWKYKPDRCADPRSVSSTPSMVLVRARQCDKSSNELQILGLDAQTGKRRWTQPIQGEGGESGPGDVLVRPGFQLELSNRQLIRRNLDTGTIDWTASTDANCQQGYLQSADETAYVGECAGRSTVAPTTITGYAMQTGRQAWLQRLDEPIRAMAAIDDRSVLALTSGPKNCTLRLVRESGSTTLITLPGGDEPTDRKPGAMRCADSSLIRVNNSFVLQVRLFSGSSSSSERYRFIGLA